MSNTGDFDPFSVDSSSSGVSELRQGNIESFRGVTDNVESMRRLTDSSMILRLTPHGKMFQVKVKLKDLLPEENVNPEYVRGNKNLIDLKALKEIHNLDLYFKNQIRNLSIPETFMRGGLFIIPIDSLKKVEEMIPVYEEERKSLVEELINKYDDLIEEAKKELPERLFSYSDYPSKDLIRAKFRVSKGYMSLGLPSSLKERVPEAYRKMEGELEEIVEDIREAMRESFREIVGHISKCLGVDPETGKKPRIFDSSIDKAMEFMESFKSRNILNDIELEKLVMEAQEILRGVGAKDLRKDGDLRNSVKERIESVKGAVEELASRGGVRKLVFDDDDED